MTDCCCSTPESESSQSVPILLSKDGRFRIDRKGLKGQYLKYVRDIYTSILEIGWGWALIIFFSLYAISYIAFALFYWLLNYAHGDYSSSGDLSNGCIPELKTFAEFFLFSLETQTTIGYGAVYPNVDCPGTVPTIYFQIAIGFIIETATLGFMFAKLARPKDRTHTIQFSKNACICKENGQLVLQVQIADLRDTHLIDAQVKGMLIQEHVTQEGAVYPLYQTQIDFEINSVGGRVFLMWPVVLTHRITETSPFYGLKQADLLAKELELFVLVGGVSESTGESCQVRTSYNANGICWGYRFNNIEEFNEKKDKWSVDFKRFGSIVPCPLLCRENADEKMEF